MTMLSVTKAAKGFRLATVEDTRADLGLDGSSPSNAQLARLLDQVSGRIATVCNRAFGRQQYRQRLLAASGTFGLIGPVNRIISVSYAGGDAVPEVQYLLEDDSLRLANALPRIGDGSDYNHWCSTRGALEVEYEAGWLLPGEAQGDDFTGTTPLPAEIEQAAIQLVSVALAERGRDPTIRSENVQGIGSVTYGGQAAGAMLAHPGADAALQPYRRLALA